MNDTIQLHMMAGWGGILLGALSGVVMGLFFHRENWAGGYGSFRRRMMRLGHISFFGLGFLNLLFGLSLQVLHLPVVNLQVASVGFLSGALTMPLICLLSAWKERFRHLFFIPVLGVLAGIIPTVSRGVGS